jgi:hypothetical protein
MQLMQARLVENGRTSEQMRRSDSQETDAKASIEGENQRQVTPVVLEEIGSDERGAGGSSAATDAIHAACASFLGYGCI